LLSIILLLPFSSSVCGFLKDPHTRSRVSKTPPYSTNIDRKSKKLFNCLPPVQPYPRETAGEGGWAGRRKGESGVRAAGTFFSFMLKGISLDPLTRPQYTAHNQCLPKASQDNIYNISHFAASYTSHIAKYID